MYATTVWQSQNVHILKSSTSCLFEQLLAVILVHPRGPCQLGLNIIRLEYNQRYCHCAEYK